MDSEQHVDAIQHDEILKIVRAATGDIDLTNPDLELKDLEVVLFETVRKAYELGTQHARDERDLIDELTQEVSDKRQAFAIQATIAAIMRAAGVNEITLKLDDISQVFTKHDLRLTSFDLTNGISYRLVKKEATA